MHEEQELPEKWNLKPLDCKNIEKLGHLDKFLDFVLWVLLRKTSTTFWWGEWRPCPRAWRWDRGSLRVSFTLYSKWNWYVTVVSIKSVLVLMSSTHEPGGFFHVNCRQYGRRRNEWTFSFIHLCTFYLLYFPYLHFICFPFTSDAQFDTGNRYFFIVQWISNFLEWLENNLLQIIKSSGTWKVAISMYVNCQFSKNLNI